LETADKCPVHRTLTSEIHIQTRLIRGDEDPFPVKSSGESLKRGG
jgi:hypothetical protein